MDKWFCLGLYGCWILNVIFYIIWYIRAKRDMLRRNIEWSGGFDAVASCLLIYGFLGPLGTVIIPLSIFTKTYE
jgi:hypothetical protein